MRASWIAVAWAWGLPGAAAAATVSIPYGHDVLHLPPGGKAAAMGEAALLSGDGPVAVSFNPALLARATAGRLALAHSAWLAGASHDGAFYARPGRRGVFAGAFQYVNHGGYEARDLAGAPLPGRASAAEAVLRAGYAESLSVRTAVGLSAALAFESYAAGAALSSFTFDAAAALAPWADHEGDRVRRPIRFAAVLRAVGQSRQASGLPATLAVGAGYDWPPARDAGASGAASIEADLQMSVSGWLRANAGLEYWVLDAACLRAGFRWNQQSEPYDAYTGFSGGFGIRLSGYALDYGIAPYGDLGMTHRLTLELPL